MTSQKNGFMPSVVHHFGQSRVVIFLKFRSNCYRERQLRSSSTWTIHLSVGISCFLEGIAHRIDGEARRVTVLTQVSQKNMAQVWRRDLGDEF